MNEYSLQSQRQLSQVATASSANVERDGVDFTTPIIIVGPGRSGTTLLGCVLGEHPDLYMIGETQFLLQRMWRTFFEYPNYVTFRAYSQLAKQEKSEWRQLPWYTFAREICGPELSNLPSHRKYIEATETERVAREIGVMFARMLIPPSLRVRKWGFQEIWLGSSSAPYDWNLYHMAFPKAFFIHSIRNPFSYLRSNFRNKGVEYPSEEQIVHELSQWLAMTRHARKLSNIGRRYIQFRYEDFVQDLSVVESVFSFVGLEFVKRCRRAHAIRHLPSFGTFDCAKPAEYFLTRVPGLRLEMQQLGYID